MAFKEVKRPIDGRRAFRSATDAAILSQSALLLGLGVRLGGQDIAAGARALAAHEAPLEILAKEDEGQFSIPEVPPARDVFAPPTVQRRMGRRSKLALRAVAKRVVPWARLSTACVELAERLYDQPTQENAADLLEASLLHPHELPRVAAASSYFEISTDPDRLLRVLVSGTYSEETLVRDVAATALARIMPEHPRISELMQAYLPGAGEEPGHTTLLVHGTWARNERWWQTGGDFHSYVGQRVREDVYNAADRFDWTGGYSDGARSVAAVALDAWVAERHLGGLNLFAHSHGANVAMLATHRRLRIGQLVLLSCPVHFPKYRADFSRIDDAVSIRVHSDLVILADRGGQRFSHPSIREHVLPVWFDHSATRKPTVWKKYNVAAVL
jgi:hypothetical protein